jgi:hypothetical protein
MQNRPVGLLASWDIDYRDDERNYSQFFSNYSNYSQRNLLFHVISASAHWIPTWMASNSSSTASRWNLDTRALTSTRDSRGTSALVSAFLSSTAKAWEPN